MSTLSQSCRLTGVALALMLFLAAGPAGAQPGHGSPGEKAQGDLRVLVFVDERPVGGVLVETQGVSARTNADGAVVLFVPAGEHPVRLEVPRIMLSATRLTGPSIELITEPVPVVTGEEVEVIITLDLAGRLQTIDVESAEDRAEELRKQREFAEKQATVPQGVVRGRLYTREAEEPVGGAQIYVRGAPVEARSAEDGSFELALPEGEYDLTVIHPQYMTVSLEKVEVDANRPRELRVALDRATPQLEDFVVTAPHIEGGVASLVAERRESTSVDDIIGAEEMSRSGDSDAAGALKRVTGITVVGGQFVYVRGMGERYSATLLNGQQVPSPEPERRVIPLDLFSTEVLESVIIQKSPSPDTPAEFGGGLVLLRTRSFPEKLTVEAGVSFGMLSTATFQERPTYRGGDLDWLGTDDGTRELPEPIRVNSPLREGNMFQEGFSPEELAGFARLLPVNYNVHEETVPLDSGVSLAVGNKHEVADIPLGYLLSASWGNDYGFHEGVNRRYVSGSDDLRLNNDFYVRSLTRTIGSSGILVAGAQPAEGHEVKSTTLLLRITDDETALVTGRSDDLGSDIRGARLQFVERQLVTEQLSGRHEIAALGRGLLEWRLAYSRAARDEPDRREYFYFDDSADPDDGNPDFQLSTRPAGNQRIWSDLVDTVQDVGLDYTQPFTAGWIGASGEGKARVKVGATAVWRERDYRTLRLTLRAPLGLSDEARRQSPEDIWATPNLNAEDGWILEDTTQPTDAYSAEQQIQAGYAMTTLPITRKIEVTGGVRVERSLQRVETFAQFDLDQTPTLTELDNTDILPSATGKWQLSDELVVRGGYGRTVTRPDFRELSESQYRDVITAIRYVGNPELVRGTLHNADARLEYYFSTDEMASIGAFYKHFDEPIEQVDLGGVDRSVTWDNADSARNCGLELEARRRLGFLSERVEDVFAAANVAFIRSEVSLDPESAGVSTSQERPLQGQSPYVVNLQLGYDDAAGSGIAAVLLYNVFGPRIRDVGRFDTPDTYEDPFHQLDFVYSHELGDNWKLTFKAQNLLNQDVVYTQTPDPDRFPAGETKVPRRYSPGRSFGLSLSWSY